MASKSKFQAIRGTRDLLPPETALWNRVEETAHSVFATFGFGEIRPPVFEPTELFARAVGGETDIVSKEMYTFKEGTFDFVPNQGRNLSPEVAKQLVSSFRKGEISETPSNAAAVEEIEKALGEISAAQEQLTPETFGSMVERYN